MKAILIILIIIAIALCAAYDGYTEKSSYFSQVYLVIFLIACTGYGVGSAIRGFIELIK